MPKEREIIPILLLQNMKYMQKIVLISLLALLVSCDSTSTKPDQGATSGTDSGATTSAPSQEQEEAEITSPEAGDSMVSRSIDARMQGDWNFAQSFPMLYDIVMQDADMLESVSSFAEQVITGKGLSSDEDVESLLKTRTVLQTSLGEFIRNWDEQTDDPAKLSALDQEMSKMGIRIAAVEGMFGMLVPGDMPGAAMQACSPAMKAHLSFESAAGSTVGGEYPYSNMSFFGDAVLAGEKLLEDFGKSKWAEQDKKEFSLMLRSFLGIYLRADGGYEMAAVGYPGDEMHEFGLSELESHHDFVNNHPESKFAPHVRALLASTSKSAIQPEALYVVYDAYFESEEEAKQYQFEQLLAGNDLFHTVPVELGNGKTNWLVSYRFYEDSEKATAFFTEKEKTDSEVKMMLCTWHNDGFVQSGI